MAAAVETPLSDACTSTKSATAAKPTTATAEGLQGLRKRRG